VRELRRTFIVDRDGAPATLAVPDQRLTISRSCGIWGRGATQLRQAHHHLEKDMYRIITALFVLLASVATASAQTLFPSVWQGQRGSLLKILAVDPATGSFSGILISPPTGPCPAVPYQAVGQVRGPRVVFQTSRNWTTDCRVTTVGSGRFIGPATVATRWIATYAGPNGRPVRVRGTEVFQRI
jgi:hypothetical protein